MIMILRNAFAALILAAFCAASLLNSSTGVISAAWADEGGDDGDGDDGDDGDERDDDDGQGRSGHSGSRNS
ncbi:MAG: hypothetical protein AAGI36_17830, partial [Pseudomonadota bacterium]